MQLTLLANATAMVQTSTAYTDWQWAGSGRYLTPSDPQSGWYEAQPDGSLSSATAWFGGNPGRQPEGTVAAVGAQGTPTTAGSGEVCIQGSEDRGGYVRSSTLRPLEDTSLQLPCACEYDGARFRCVGGTMSCGRTDCAGATVCTLRPLCSLSRTLPCTGVRHTALTCDS